jgi:hypothetical protein
VNQLIDDNNEGDEDEDGDNVDYDIQCKIKAKDIFTNTIEQIQDLLLWPQKCNLPSVFLPGKYLQNSAHLFI